MSPAWRFVLYFGGYLMLLPATLVGLTLALTVYGGHAFRWHEGALMCVAELKADGHTSKIWGNPGAQTLGWLVIGASEAELERVDLRVHELAHVAQALACALGGLVVYPVVHVVLGGEALTSAFVAPFSGGLVFAVTYGVLFGVPFALQGFRRWHDAYMKNPLEKHAYRVGYTNKGWGSRPLSR